MPDLSAHRRRRPDDRNRLALRAFSVFRPATPLARLDCVSAGRIRIIRRQGSIPQVASVCTPRYFPSSRRRRRHSTLRHLNSYIQQKKYKFINNVTIRMRNVQHNVHKKMLKIFRMLTLNSDGQGESKGAALPDGTLRSDTAPMCFYYMPRDSQS